MIVDVFTPHSMIADCIRSMVRIAAINGYTARQELNGVSVLVNSDSDVNLIFRDHQRAQSGCIAKTVGPYPNVFLTVSDLESDARIKADNERQQRARVAEYEAQARAKREATEAKLADAPAMDLADAAAWQRFVDANRDPYGSAAVSYAERWARLMQREMLAGARLEDVAEPTSHEADTDGITGFMHGAAVSMLARAWVHGDRLRRWHNVNTQISDEGERANETGGVLNPALLSLAAGHEDAPQ